MFPEVLLEGRAVTDVDDAEIRLPGIQHRAGHPQPKLSLSGLEFAHLQGTTAMKHAAAYLGIEFGIRTAS